jgi:pimeloyl-ACP methyl ester carboxylesterase
MTERTVRANGIEIWSEDFGKPTDPALLLVMGAGGQGVLWPDELCQALAAGGRRVIRYDNRDTGQSTCLDFAKSPYTLSDMARDAIGVLDAYRIERADVVGASMGGMIVQTLALEHPGRVRTLTSIMSSPLSASLMKIMMGGAAEAGALPGPHAKVQELMASRAGRVPQNDAERNEAAVDLWRVLSGSGEPFDEAAVRARETRILARAKNIDASQNHQLAIASTPDRDAALRELRVPTLVIHGAEDPILPLAHGRATADLVPGARFLVIDGMGHDFPSYAQKAVVQAILAHTG